MHNVTHGQESQQQDFDRSTLDLEHIRRNIDIEGIAILLGIEVNERHFATCFRPENHRNGDSNPSLHFLPRKNCAFCFHCDARAMSNIDFVMAVLGCSFAGAVRWFRENFHNLPTLRGRPAGIVRERPIHVGKGGDLEHLIRSCVLPLLSEKAAILLFIIEQLRDEKGAARVSYATFRRYTGIGSDTTVRQKLKELLDLHIIETRKRRVGPLEPDNVYVLTPDHPDLVELMNRTYRSQREAIDQECEYYREAKRARRRKAKQEEPSAA